MMDKNLKEIRKRREIRRLYYERNKREKKETISTILSKE